jgi:ATP-grasp domain
LIIPCDRTTPDVEGANDPRRLWSRPLRVWPRICQPVDCVSGADMRALILFNYDWDAAAFEALSDRYPHDCAGFDLFSFPSNAQLVRFDLERFIDKLARAAIHRNWRAALSNHEQFGALAAALLAERLGWPGTPVQAILACQHKLYAREVMARVCPDVNVGFAPLDAEYGGPVPKDLAYPLFVKPVKAAFSVLARRIDSEAALFEHTRFSAWELWVIRRLVEPYERIARQRLPGYTSAHRLLIEECVNAPQYNLDGYVYNGAVHEIGFVDAVMYPGTQAFMHFETPSHLPLPVRARALHAATRFLKAIGFSHGLFNMEFLYDETTDRMAVIEFNPRFASQFGDLYRRVAGIDAHEIALALAHGRDPATLPRHTATAGAAASVVYRAFPGDAHPTMPDKQRIAQFKARFPDALLFQFPKRAGQMQRDFKWLGSYRYGIVHLGGDNAGQLREHCEQTSEILGWSSPYREYHQRHIATSPRLRGTHVIEAPVQ